MLLRRPGATWVPDRRYVSDRGVATTTGVSASVPAMLALVEAIGGRDRARALARELGVDSWDSSHDSARFGLGVRFASTYVVDKLAFWRDERWQIAVEDGVDDIALALVADAWSRTGRVRVVAASDSGSVRLRSGLKLATAVAELYNPAQLDVLSRASILAHELLQESGASFQQAPATSVLR